MTEGVGHSRQRRGLDKGAGSEALTGDGHRSEQSSGGVAVPSFSQCSCARRRVRVVGGCCSRGESRGKRRMEELTGVVRSAETKQSEAASGEVEKWPNSLSQLEQRGDKAGLDGHTRPALGQQRGREVAGGRAAVARARPQRSGGR
jgi:hypothetical protein